jgi:hypothetical protein
MCSQAHGDAEETLRYFLGQASGDHELLQRMALESLMFSHFMVDCAVLYFLKACFQFSTCFGLQSADESIARALSNVEREIEHVVASLP